MGGGGGGYSHVKNMGNSTNITFLLEILHENVYALCTSLRVRMALSMSARLGGWRAWLRIFLGSPRSSFLAFKTTVSRGQRCGE